MAQPSDSLCRLVSFAFYGTHSDSLCSGTDLPTLLFLYTGPVPAERESPMARSEMSPSRTQHSPPTQRPNACCFCWCCCCSCSCLTIRREDESRRRLKSQETKLETIPNCEACTKPTVEEIKQWAHSFDKLMKNPAGRNVFREFLRTEYSEENMLFWLSCEDLKKEINKSMIEEKARMIYEDYISILSPKEIGMDCSWGRGQTLPTSSSSLLEFSQLIKFSIRGDNSEASN
ncbi:regulator of G-protein signaling 19 isoform X4 [Tachysurus ichikawai]